MTTGVKTGYLLLADLSGFDAYLAGVELDHAQGVVQELLELIVHQLTPPLQFASLEGDGVLVHAPREYIPRGETLLELSEATYVVFRDRVKAIHRNNTCDCRACQAVPSLDLKFLVHFGEYAVQPGPAGNFQLGGLDASLVRERLIKDQVRDANETDAYILFTDQSLAQIGIQPDGMARAVGEYPHHGQVRTALLDLEPRYQAQTEARRAYVAPEAADLVLTHDFPVPPAILWDWLNDPEKRTRWMIFRTWTAGLRPGGRTGIGARNHCAHGMGVLLETVQDWRPFAYFTVVSGQDSLRFSFMQTYQLEPLPGGGTRLQVNSRLQETTPAWFGRPLLIQVAGRLWRRDLKRLAELLAADQGGGED